MSARRPFAYSVTRGLLRAGSSLAAAAGAWILFSRFGIDHQLPLPEALVADRETFSDPTIGQLSYYADRSGDGHPVVLLHSINAAASACEMLPLFEHYRTTRPVYALELPGFGFSERSPRLYSPQLYADAILAFLREKVGEEADVIALSLSSEFAARAAVESPELFRSLTLISPTGLGQPKERDEDKKLSTLQAFSFPVWSQALYDLIASKPSIRYFLQKSFVGPVPDGLVDYSYSTSHQEGARFAPLAFISGVLFTPDVKERFYSQLAVPSLILFDRDAFTGFELLPDLVQNSDWVEAARIVNTMGLPHFEKLAETTDELDRFWTSLTVAKSE